MSIFDIFRAPEVKSAPTHPAPAQVSWPTFFFGGGAVLPDGDKLVVHVGPETAMRCPPVRQAVRVLSDAVSTMPLHLYQRHRRDGSKERAIDHPVYRVLHRLANPLTSAARLREALMTDALLWGNGFAVITRGGNQVELWHISAQAVFVEHDQATYEPKYFVSHGDGQRIEYSASQIFHIKGPGIHDYVGDSPIIECANAIALCMLMEAHGKGFFENRGRPSGIFLMRDNMTEPQLEAARKAFAAKAHGNLMLPGASSYVPIAFSSVDSQFLESRKEQVIEIARVFGVPPHALFELGRSTWANITAQRQEFLDGSLSSWLKRFEDEVFIKLLSPDEQEIYFAEFLTDNFLRMDPVQRAEAQSKRIASRTLSPNEARAQENLPPYPGGDEFVNPNTTSSTIAIEENSNEDDQ